MLQLVVAVHQAVTKLKRKRTSERRGEEGREMRGVRGEREKESNRERKVETSRERERRGEREERRQSSNEICVRKSKCYTHLSCTMLSYMYYFVSVYTLNVLTTKPWRCLDNTGKPNNSTKREREMVHMTKGEVEQESGGGGGGEKEKDRVQ